jgi:hypothetical protein
MELAPLAKQRFFDSNGLPLSGGKLYTYDAGTTTPKTTYSDRSGTANTNPVILDSNGYADVWIDSGYYKFVLKDSSDNTIWTKDQISIPSEAALASAFWRDVVYVTSADSPLTLTQTHNGKLLSVDASGGAVTINLPQISLTTLPYNIGLKLTNATNTCTINRTGTDTLEGATSKVVNTTNASCQLIADIDKSPDQWAVLDFGVVDFSGYTAAIPIAEDFVTIVDTSAGSINKKASFKYFKNAVIRSVTTTDTVGTDDDVMKLSGASFTSTLPNASGIDGKRYTYIHAGTSLTQIYTVTGTGLASNLKLHTNGQILRLISDGTNWLVDYSKTNTDFSATTTITLGAVTTAPTKGTIVTDSVQWTRGGRFATILYRYNQSTAGTVGSGDVLFSFPSGLSADTAVIPTYSGVLAGTTSSAQASNLPMAGNICYGTNYAANCVFGVLYSSTQFRVFWYDPGGPSAGVLGSSFGNPMGTANAGFSFNITVPILDWIP